MNLLCPNCQKMLTVPEEYAGQLMQCPLCRGTFTMPALPTQSGGATMPAKPPAAPPPPDTFTIPLPPSGVFQAPPELKRGSPPPPGGKPAGPVMEPSAPMEPVMMPGPAGGYRHAIPLRFNPAFLRWMVPVCLILVLVLSFFSWIGSFPGGVTIASQTGWQTAFGGWKEGELLEKARGDKSPKNPLNQIESPKASIWMIFCLILTCLAVLFGVAFVVFNLMPANAGAFIVALRRWQGLILGGIGLLALLFLLIENLVGPQLTKMVAEPIDEFAKQTIRAPTPDLEEQMQKVARGAMLAAACIHHTLWYGLTVILLILAVLGGYLEFWGSRRGHRPPPKIEFAW